MFANSIYRSISYISLSLLLTGCPSHPKMVKLGDNEMSCRQIKDELDQVEKQGEEERKHSTIGYGVGAAGLVLFAPLALMGGLGYGAYKSYKYAGETGRGQFLISNANKKGCSFSNGTPNQNQASHDTTTIKIQQSLIKKGYEPGVADGIYGEKTKVALQKFQEDNGLTVTGKIDEATKNMLLN